MISEMFHFILHSAYELASSNAFIGVIVGVLAKLLQDYLTKKGYFRPFAIFALCVGLVVLLFVFSNMIRQPHVEMLSFVGLLIIWGIAVYVVICESLLLGLASRLNKLQPRGRWIREIEYPYLLLGLIGLFVTINRITMLEHRITDYELYGPLILVTATSIKFVKTRAEVSKWDTL